MRPFAVDSQAQLVDRGELEVAKLRFSKTKLTSGVKAIFIAAISHQVSFSNFIVVARQAALGVVVEQILHSVIL